MPLLGGPAWFNAGKLIDARSFEADGIVAARVCQRLPAADSDTGSDVRRLKLHFQAMATIRTGNPPRKLRTEHLLAQPQQPGIPFACTQRAALPGASIGRRGLQ
jgi:hypothetical protein